MEEAVNERTNETGGCCFFFLLGGFATAGAARSIPIRDEIYSLYCSARTLRNGVFFIDCLSSSRLSSGHLTSN